MHTTAGAQDTTRVQRDSIRADSIRADSIERARVLAVDRRVRSDSLKKPLARAEFPASTDIGPAFQYDRQSLPASGALSLGELLERVPGLTVFRSGWMGSPHVAASNGEFGRVRIFYDGVEMDDLDPRNAGIPDLSFIDLWQLEGARIERGANETRVHLRSWSTRSTTPETRVDVTTGDLETNLYRGYFSKRFTKGQALQLGAYDYSTRDPRYLADVDQLSLFGRFGWAGRGWSFDASLLRTNRNRTKQMDVAKDSLRSLDARRDIALARLAYGDVDRDGVWVQAIASSQRFRASHPDIITIDSIPGPEGGSPEGSPEAKVTVRTSGDTTASVPQYVTSAGWNRGPLRLSVGARLRSIAGSSKLSETVRLGYEQPRFAVGLFGERAPNDRVTRTEVSGRFLPTTFFAIGGAVSRHTAQDGSLRPSTMAMRAEAGLRLGRMWATGGVMTRDTALLLAPVVFDTAYRSASEGPTTGIFGTLRGKVWRDIGIEFSGTRWDNAGVFRPRYQTRSEAYINTSWPGRFPSGHLNIMFAVIHEYRTQALFPVAITADSTELVPSTQYRSIGTILEIKLLSATLTYQYRNILGAQYQQVPRFEVPRTLSIYGVRWYFFN